MSTEYLTRSEALSKVGQSTSTSNSNWFCTKQWLSTNGNFDSSKLSSYENNEFVVDDDIVKGSTEPDTRYTLTFNSLDVKFTIDYADFTGKSYSINFQPNTIIAHFHAWLPNEEYWQNVKIPVSYTLSQSNSYESNVHFDQFQVKFDEQPSQVYIVFYQTDVFPLSGRGVSLDAQDQVSRNLYGTYNPPSTEYIYSYFLNRGDYGEEPGSRWVNMTDLGNITALANRPVYIEVHFNYNNTFE